MAPALLQAPGVAEQSLLGCQRLQINRAAHRFVARGVGMEVIPLVVFWQRVARSLWIDDDLVEVDDAVKGAATDKLVQRQANLLFLWV